MLQIRGSIGSSNGAEAEIGDLVSMNVITRDGAFELLLHPTVARDLQNRIAPQVPPPKNALSATPSSPIKSVSAHSLD